MLSKTHTSYIKYQQESRNYGINITDHPISQILLLKTLIQKNMRSLKIMYIYGLRSTPRQNLHIK